MHRQGGWPSDVRSLKTAHCTSCQQKLWLHRCPQLSIVSNIYVRFGFPAWLIRSSTVVRSSVGAILKPPPTVLLPYVPNQPIRCSVGSHSTHLHRDVNPKFTFANKTQYILSFVTEIQSYIIGVLKSFIVGNYPYQLVKTLKTPLCNVKSKK